MILDVKKILSPSLLAEIDQQIRLGNGRQAQLLLKPLLGKKLPREANAQVAQLARRAHLPLNALKMLNPLVRPSGKDRIVATSQEKVEYAGALTYLGGAEEALLLLSQIQPEEAPEALLYEAFAHFAKWDYGSAIPVLTRYLRISGIDPYFRLVGKVNLASALVYEGQWDRANYLLNELLHSTGIRHWALLQGNSLELAAHYHLLRRQWSKAEVFLDQAERRLKESESVDALFVEKWRAVLKFLKNPEEKEDLLRLRAQALQREHWETVRDIDRWIGIVRKDRDLLNYLYFGTPHEKWREKLLRDLKEPLELPDTYVWRIGQPENVGSQIDVLSGEIRNSDHRLPAGQAPYRLLVALASDFYRPQRMAALHFTLFPGEFFNPVSSPRRVHETVRRLRHWFEETGLPLEVAEEGGAYRLASETGCGILLHREKAGAQKLDIIVNQLKEKFELQPFSAVQAGQAIHASARSALRFLEAAIRNQTIEKVGTGSQTKYRVKKAA